MPSQPYGAGAFAYPGVGGARVLLPDAAPDGEIYVNTAQAAEAMGVKQPTIRSWVRAGRLPEPAPGWYKLSDVAAAEAIARQNAIATSGTDKRVQRSHLEAA
jgi:excisionase family DNA binding protein